MPSFDVVSDFDAHEASNAVDQANREVNTRFDFNRRRKFCSLLVSRDYLNLVSNALDTFDRSNRFLG